MRKEVTMTSILTSVKKNLGIDEKSEDFDVDIITHINTAFQILFQLGAIENKGFFIEDKSVHWDDLLGESTDMEAIKTYVYAKVRLMFDPPQSSSHLDALKGIVSELEWRLSIAPDANNIT